MAETDKKKGIPVRSEADGADARVQVKIVDGAAPGPTAAKMEVTEKLAHVRIHGKDPGAVKRQMLLSEEGHTSINGIRNVSTNTDPSNIGIIGHVRNASPTDADQTLRLTGKANAAGDTRALDVAIHTSDGEAISIANPLPTFNSPDPGDETHDFKDNELAALGSGTHEFTVVDGKTFELRQILADASSRFRYKLEIGDGDVSEVFADKAIRFQSENNSKGADIELLVPIFLIGTVNGTTVKLTIQNRDDDDTHSIYTTIVGILRDTP